MNVNNTKLPQLTYSSTNNVKTSSYLISNPAISTEHLNIIEFVENSESTSFISKPKNLLNYMNLLVIHSNYLLKWSIILIKELIFLEIQ